MKIGIDIDEVLADTVVNILAYYNGKHKTNFSREDVKQYELWSVWGGTREEAIEKVHEFYETEHFTSLPVLAGAPAVVKKLSTAHELFIITSRPSLIHAKTLAWLDSHFPGMFAKVLFTNEWARGPAGSFSKADLCKQEAIDLLIEDGPRYARECSAFCKHVLLMEHPWNRHETFPSNVHRVRSWNEVLQRVHDLTA